MRGARSEDPDRVPAATPLPRRATDRVEDVAAWVLSAGALLVIMAACLTGLAVHGREAERIDLGGTSASQTRAVLLQDAVVTTGDYGMHHLVPTPVRWTDAAGAERTGVIVLPGAAPAGTEVDVWTDPAGNITAAPLQPVNAVVGGVIAAIGVLCAGGTLLLATWFGVRLVTGRLNSRRWERGWTRVEPLWRRTVL